MSWIPTHPLVHLAAPDLGTLMAVSSPEVTETWTLAGRLAARRLQDEARLRAIWVEVHGPPSTTLEQPPPSTPVGISPTDLLRAIVVRHASVVEALVAEAPAWEGLPTVEEARAAQVAVETRCSARPDDPPGLQELARAWGWSWALALALGAPPIGAAELLKSADPALEGLARLLSPRGGWDFVSEALGRPLAERTAWSLPPIPPIQLVRAADSAWLASSIRESGAAVLLGQRSARALADVVTHALALDPLDQRFDGGERLWLRDRCVDESAILSLGPDAMVHVLARDPARRLREELSWVPISRITTLLDEIHQGSGDGLILIVPPEGMAELVQAVPAVGALPCREIPDAPAILVELCRRWPIGEADPMRSLGEAIATLRRGDRSFHPWLGSEVPPESRTARRWLCAWSLLASGTRGESTLSDEDRAFIQRHGGSSEEVRELVVGLGALSARWSQAPG